MLNELKDEILDKLVGEAKEIIIEKDGTVRFPFYDVKKKEKFDSEYWYKILTSEHRQLNPAFKIPIEDVQETAILDKVGDVEGYKFQESDKEFLKELVQMRENIRNYNFDAWKGIRK